MRETYTIILNRPKGCSVKTPKPLTIDDAEFGMSEHRRDDVGVYGPMCRDPKLCAGKGYCPRDPTCAD